MPVSYKKLFELLDQKKIRKIDLRTKYEFNPKTVDSLVKNKYVSLETVEKLCNILGCEFKDIIEFVPKEENEQDSP